jgi:hypothetical protein
MPETKALVERFINCHTCWTQETCQVEFGYTEAGRINSAQVTRLPQGWQYRPLGEAGGQAPICPACQPD